MCDICSKTFARSDLLVRHERLVHPGDNIEARGANQSASQNAHQNSHTSHAHQPSSSSLSDHMEVAPQSHSMMSPPPMHEERLMGMENMVDPQLMQSPNDSRGEMHEIPPHQASLLGAPPLDPSWGYDLNLLSHAASHVASTGQTPLDNVPHMPQVSHEPMQALRPNHSTPQYQPKMLIEGYGNQAPLFDTPDLVDPMQDFSIFLDSVGLPSAWHSGIFNAVEHNPFTSPMLRYDDPAGMPRTQLNGGPFDPRSTHSQDETNAFSRFGSRLPSLQPEIRDQDSIMVEGRSIEESSAGKSRHMWEISDSDRQTFMNKLDSFTSVLPKGFIAPSKHSLSRYLAGYINGFHEHLPFIHVPSLSVATSAPELVLTLAAVGAQYRFENSRGIELFYAAKAVVLEQIRQRDAYWAPAIPWHRSNTLAPSSANSLSAPSPSPGPFSSYLASADISEPNDGAQMGSIQALLLLTAFATWERNRELLREALAFQSILARLVRESGLTSPDTVPSVDDLSWEEWIAQEGAKRIKLIVYCFFNLHSITWNIPPLILNAEVHLNLPDPADEWKALSATQWKKLRRANATPPVPFQTTFARLFSKAPSSPGTPVSPLGNYILIHAIIQQIFFARQLSTFWPATAGASLRSEDVVAFEHGLSAWKAGWKRAPESSLDPQNPNGPVAFTSTAFLGLAYIRLHVDMGPIRHLESRDAMQVALALRDTPPIQRSPRLVPALLHSAHALSIPIRLGIDFVAKTQTFFWSIQHSLCSLECAFLLSKWLASFPALPSQAKPPLSEHERKLLVWVRGMLDETEVAVPINAAGHGNGYHRLSESRDVIDDNIEVKQLSVSVVRIWAKTFKGNTSWAIVDLIGSALELYAEMLESDGS